MKKKIILRVIVFILTATVTAFLVNKLNNLGLNKISKEMSEPTLPIVYCEIDGEVVNRMFGYTQVMSTSLMRDGVVPLNENHGVNLLVDDEHDFGKKYSYQLRSIAGDSLVEEGELSLGSMVSGYRQCPVTIRMDLRENQEYVLVFIVEGKNGDVARYYTRVVDLEDNDAHKIVEYAHEFHNTAIKKTSSAVANNVVYDALKYTGFDYYDDLSHVDIAASYKLMTWGDLKPTVITEVATTITEIDKDYTVVHLQYVIEAESGGSLHYYNVDEYYTGVYDKSSGNVELLDYHRYQESMFDTEYIYKDSNSLAFGVTSDDDVEYVTAEDNEKLAFVREGELWYYDYGTTSVTSVFTFNQGDYTDIRSMNSDMDINIVDMNDAGEIYFVVYGYMCRGDHEGKNGISLYHFSPEDYKIEELFFVSVDEPFDIMQQETGRFTYYDQKGHFYYLLDGAIYDVDLATMEQTTISEGLSSDKYAVSENRRVVAYPNSNLKEETNTIVIRDFLTGEVTYETGGDSDRFAALGFVGDDLICGVADAKDVYVPSDGEAILPFYKLMILNPVGDVLKEYHKDGVYIMDALVQSDKIYLERGLKRNNFFEDTEPDFISYKPKENENAMLEKTFYDMAAYDEQHLVFPSYIYLSDTNNIIMTKSKVNDRYKAMEVKTSTNPESFYVFDNVGYVGEFASAGAAIIEVNEMGTGQVVDSKGNAIYRSIAADSYNTVADSIYQVSCTSVDDSLLTCAYMCIDYEGNRVEYEQVMACDSWEDAFETHTLGVGINISGIDLSTALYFLDRDIPFAACIDDGRYVLVISYNEAYVRYYDPILDEEVRILRDEFEEALSLQGNTMYTYTAQ
ncbi:MAG: hypothetical protein IJX85_00450 [Lachnospiraceae bacterium]|nr:hypothetical protein [Lachnospiraceae bacterium]